MHLPMWNAHTQTISINIPQMQKMTINDQVRFDAAARLLNKQHSKRWIQTIEWKSG